MEYELIYLNHVNKMLEHLRTRCLGQDTLMSDILSRPIDDLSQEDQAVQITEILLFALVKADASADPAAHEIAACRIWLYHAILHILQTEEPENCTFSTLKTLLSLPGNIRKLYFEYSPDYGIQSIYAQEPPLLLRNFDLVLLWVLKVRELKQSAENTFEKLELLLDYNSP